MKSAAALITLLLSVAGSNAATTVLYQTDWEPAPATPAWVLGAVNGQNSWSANTNGFLVAPNGFSGFLVVSNGSANAVIGGQSVVTPYGHQFLRVVADAATTKRIDHFGWPDIGPAVASLPSSQKKISASFDVYVPSFQANDSSYYGLLAWHETSAPWGVFVEADDQSINLVFGSNAIYVDEAFDFDTWFNLKVTADYATGDLSVAMNGELLSITENSPGILLGTLQDIDLWSFNSASSPGVRAVFMDNYRVTADGAAANPTLTIQPGAIGEWHLSWDAFYFDWILESTQDISSTSWINEGVTPVISGGIASVDLSNAPPHRFYRLRKP